MDRDVFFSLGGAATWSKPPDEGGHSDIPSPQICLLLCECGRRNNGRWNNDTPRPPPKMARY